MDPNMRNERRRRFYQRRERREENQPLIRADSGAKRQRKLKDFLQRKTVKQRSSGKAEAAQNPGSEGEFEIMQIPDDLLFKVFSLLPAESLVKLQFVCKKWYALVNGLTFIKFHAQQSETVLISQDLIVDRPHTSYLVLPPVEPKPHFHYLDLSRGYDNFVESCVSDLVEIRASCDGLVLGIRAKKKGLILMNPFTRKHAILPLGTVGFNDSYGFAFCIQARTYKVAHLFRDAPGYTVCEILNVSTRKWTCMDGPSSELLHDVAQRPVSVRGSLYWMPREHGSDYFVSMDLEDEKFSSMKLPIFCAVNDRLVDVGGALGFVTHATLNLMQVWVLKGRENWVKRFSIYMNFDVTRVVPICSSRNGKEIVFEYPGNHLYVYDMETGDTKEVYSRDDEEYCEGAETLFIPHRNTLASWEDIIN
ncbi:F-box protein-like [Dorcoceras hygrometricum]|uniref:F-box protein-like n=1 Tax=Dorcoceras hygrometricum TaxID=472368 RepID=A0A2Z7DHD4_9LAMI|nr:F-box protein-like [Dorcoceras hygrometricum]